MTSANAAVKRLQSESLQQKALNELKQDAAELGLSKEDVKQFGNLTHKQTWLDAIGDAIAREFDAVETEEEAPAQPNNDPITEPEATEIACLIDHPALAEGKLREPADGGFYIGKDERDLPLQFGLVNSEDDSLTVYTLKSSAPIPPLIVEDCDRQIFNKTYGIYRNLPIFPIRDELLEQMEKYVGDCIQSEDFEQLKNEPLDEYTAAVYLGWLEESKRMVREAIAA